MTINHHMADSFKRLFSILLLCLLSSAFMSLAAQVTGTVTEEDGEPLTGATISVEGTKLATVADLDGNFSIDAKAGQTLKVTYIGKMTATVKVEAGKKHYDIVMKDDNQVLSEVVVVGYGTMEKKRVTSAITSVTADDMMSGLGGATIATALQGKISGLTTTGNSSPNASNGYQLRGVASVNAGQGPLVVIDGVPGGDIRAINQEDIQSIDVLKDASAGAIYGTRAAAGVILVTTKRAKEGKT
ncbi:MAG: TonB-dependent receptor plug domain-containing protein, partial [Muribaculaceae bacterium]|nr:TonB-dependent receptor plug domain-containing protein [Muribaculaceae bacterium]